MKHKPRNVVDGVYESVDLGLTGGLRYDITDKISVATRYYYGIKSLQEAFFTTDGITGKMIHSYNHNIQVSVYYTIK